MFAKRFKTESVEFIPNCITIFVQTVTSCCFMSNKVVHTPADESYTFDEFIFNENIRFYGQDFKKLEILEMEIIA